MDYPAIRKVLWQTLLLNWLAAAFKLAVGVAAGSLGALADGLEALLDGLSNVIGLVGIAIASRPPDRHHPYGHRKFETLAALVIALLLLLTSWNLIERALDKFRAPSPPDISTWMFGLLFAALLIQALTARYELALGRRLHSSVLIADARGSQAGATVSLAVLAGLIAVRRGVPAADPLIAIGVALFIAYFALAILREFTPILVDRAPIEAERLAGVVAQVKGVESFDRIRSRGSTSDAAVDLRIRVAPHHSIEQAHAIAAEVRRRLLELPGVNDVTVHLEAERDPKAAAGPFALVRQVAHGLGLELHESWAHEAEGRLHLIAHVGVDEQLSLGQAHDLVDDLERESLARLPPGTSLRTHIEPIPRELLRSKPVEPEVEAAVRATVERAVRETPGLSQAHNLRVRRAGGQLHIVLDCMAMPDLPLKTAHELSTELELKLKETLPNVGVVAVHVEPPAAVDR